MSEQTTTAEAGQQTEQAPAEGKAFEPITSQEDFDKAIQARIARERAKTADYDALKEKASRLDQLEEEGKTEAQKVAEKLAAAEKRAAEAEAQVLRSTVATDKGVPASLLTGSTEDELKASADALLQFKGPQASGPQVRREGKSPAVHPSDEKEFVHGLFGTSE